MLGGFNSKNYKKLINISWYGRLVRFLFGVDSKEEKLFEEETSCIKKCKLKLDNETLKQLKQQKIAIENARKQQKLVTLQEYKRKAELREVEIQEYKRKAELKEVELKRKAELREVELKKIKAEAREARELLKKERADSINEEKEKVLKRDRELKEEKQKTDFHSNKLITSNEKKIQADILHGNTIIPSLNPIFVNSENEYEIMKKLYPPFDNSVKFNKKCLNFDMIIIDENLLKYEIINLYKKFKYFSYDNRSILDLWYYQISTNLNDEHGFRDYTGKKKISSTESEHCLIFALQMYGVSVEQINYIKRNFFLLYQYEFNFKDLKFISEFLKVHINLKKYDNKGINVNQLHYGVEYKDNKAPIELALYKEHYFLNYRDCGFSICFIKNIDFWTELASKTNTDISMFYRRMNLKSNKNSKRSMNSLSMINMLFKEGHFAYNSNINDISVNTKKQLTHITTEYKKIVHSNILQSYKDVNDWRNLAFENGRFIINKVNVPIDILLKTITLKIVPQLLKNVDWFCINNSTITKSSNCIKLQICPLYDEYLEYVQICKIKNKNISEREKSITVENILRFSLKNGNSSGKWMITLYDYDNETEKKCQDIWNILSRATYLNNLGTSIKISSKPNIYGTRLICIYSSFHDMNIMKKVFRSLVSIAKKNNFLHLIKPGYKPDVFTRLKIYSENIKEHRLHIIIFEDIFKRILLESC
jgi:hypothetical protein